MEYFLKNFRHVPDDKLDWTPAPTAQSAIRIAAHTALYAGRFASMIRDRTLPTPENVDDWVAACVAEELSVTGREQMEEAFRKGTAEVVAAIDALTSDDLDIVMESGQGFAMPMGEFINLPGWHATLHAGQIDFLQTCWGDQEIYLG